MFRVITVVLLCLSLGGCGLAMRYEAQKKAEEARLQHKAASEACLARYSENPADAIPRAKCFNEADQAYMPTTRYPDLIALRMAKRMELAERYAAGKITRPQMVLELAQLNSAEVGEEQRRMNSSQMVAAQQEAASAASASAIAASMPRTTTCTRIGNSVTCN